MNRSRNFVFTLNNYSPEEYDAVLALPGKYLIVGKEVGVSGTPHLQGYIVFDILKSVKCVSKLMPRAHIEIAKGDVDQNYTYCSKGGSFIEVGVKPVSQKRKGEMESERWELALGAAKAGRFEDIPADIQVKYCKNLEFLHQKYSTGPSSLDWADSPNQWIYGRAGVGKSRKAFEENPGAYRKDLSKWWDGYKGEPCVLVDDMDPFHKSMAFDFKLWGDRYPFRADRKGASDFIRPMKVVVTSQYRIDEVWEDEATREAIKRRFVEIYIPSGDLITDNKFNI